MGEEKREMLDVIANAISIIAGVGVIVEQVAKIVQKTPA